MSQVVPCDDGLMTPSQARNSPMQSPANSQNSSQSPAHHRWEVAVNGASNAQSSRLRSGNMAASSSPPSNSLIPPSGVDSQKSTGPRFTSHLTIASNMTENQQKNLLHQSEKHDTMIEQMKRKREELIANEKHSPLHDIVKSDRFQLLVCLVIFVNAITIGIETDLGEGAWGTIETAFLVIYIIELTLRIVVDKMENLKDPWFYFDAFLLICGVMDFVFELISAAEVALSEMIVFRILRLMKLARLFRLLRFFRELLLLVNSIASALKTLTWTWVLLALVIYVFSILYTKSLGHAYPDDEEVQQLWGTVPRSAFTLFGILTLDSWVAPTRKTWDVSPVMVLVTLMYITLTAFAIMNVVIAVIVEGTIQTAMTNQDDLQRKLEEDIKNWSGKLVDVFCMVDTDGDGRMVREEFEAALKIPNVKSLLQELELDNYDVEYLFDHLDIDLDGKITLTEFVQGTLQLKGQARAKRLFEVHCDLVRQHNTTQSKMALQTEIMQEHSDELRAVSERQQDLARVLEAQAEKMDQMQELFLGQMPKPACPQMDTQVVKTQGTAPSTQHRTEVANPSCPQRGEDTVESTKLIQPQSMQRGDAVRIRGLQENPDLNDSIGVVIRIEDNGRVIIDLGRGQPTFSVKVENLESAIVGLDDCRGSALSARTAPVSASDVPLPPPAKDGCGVNQEQQSLRLNPEQHAMVTSPIGVPETVISALKSLEKQHSDRTSALESQVQGLSCMVHRLLEWPNQQAARTRALEAEMQNLCDIVSRTGTQGVSNGISPSGKPIKSISSTYGKVDLE